MPAFGCRRSSARPTGRSTPIGRSGGGTRTSGPPPEPCGVGRGGGGPVLLEPTNPLRVDISFVFWQRDAMDLARRAGTKVMLDFQSSWYERGLEQVVRRNIDLVGLTQLSDYVIGTAQTGDRVVPGDGDIPLERLLRMVLDAGFEGSFDLEVFG